MSTSCRPFSWWSCRAKLSRPSLERNRPNVGRLKTVIKDQIYQQTYGGGGCNSTLLLSRNKDAILVHIAPHVTMAFLDDVRALRAPPSGIWLFPNEAHESYAPAFVRHFPNAKVLCPKPSAERSFVLDLYDGSGPCLFVAQCGYANFTTFVPMLWLGGFQGLFTRGRLIRQFYWAFTKPSKSSQVKTYWQMMVGSNNWKAAVFTHGSPILEMNGNLTVKEQLLKFYVY